VSRERFSITFMSGPLDGKTMEWTVPSTTKPFVLPIGRAEGSAIHIGYDSQVSRIHANVIYAIVDDLFFLEDLGSRNGTHLGQVRIPQNERVPLIIGELFRIGRTWLRIDPETVEYEDDFDDIPF